jgi:methyl-accepting chemotaxis protein
MQWFNDMKVGQKLVLAFTLVAAIGAVIGFEGIRNASQLNEIAGTMYDREMFGLNHAQKANAQLLAAGRAIRSAVLATDAAERTERIKVTDQRLADVRKEVALTRKTMDTPDGQKLVAQVEAAINDYSVILDQVKTALATEELADLRESTTRLKHSRDIANKADELMTKLGERKLATARSLNEQGAAMFTSVRMALIGLTLGGVLTGVVIGLLIARNLTRQLGGEPAYAADIAKRIAEGDLTTEVHIASGDTGSMLHAMKNMRDSLARIVGQVRTGSDAIASATGEIAAGNLDLSARTEQQASSLEETASSMEELTSTVKQNSDNARQANALAASASAVAVKGGMVVSQVVETMGAINESASKIVDIISVIDGIAFQTNILALNAAVEAARAGEQGRGFAVVASEVRNLAQRSASAAKEIKSLIGDSVERVETGSKLVDEAGSTMEEIVVSVKRVTDIMAEIAAAGHEQELGIGQINQAIGEMDGVTQQNAGLVEEAAAAAESLQQQAATLSHLVSVFKVGREREAGARSPAAPARVAQPKPRRPAPAPARLAPAMANGGDWEEF